MLWMRWLKRSRVSLSKGSIIFILSGATWYCTALSLIFYYHVRFHRDVQPGLSSYGRPAGLYAFRGKASRRPDLNSSSRVMVPSKPGSINPAVACTTIARRPKLLRPSTRATRSGRNFDILGSMRERELARVQNKGLTFGKLNRHRDCINIFFVSRIDTRQMWQLVHRKLGSQTYIETRRLKLKIPVGDRVNNQVTLF